MRVVSRLALRPCVFRLGVRVCARVLAWCVAVCLGWPSVRVLLRLGVCVCACVLAWCVTEYLCMSARVANSCLGGPLHKLKVLNLKALSCFDGVREKGGGEVVGVALR